MYSEIFVVVSLAAKAAFASPFADAEPAAAAITPAPVLFRRELADNFVGFEIDTDGYFDTDTEWTCNSPYTYTYSSGYADCCDGPCALATDCSAGTVVSANGDTVACNSYCLTKSIFYSTDDNDPAWFIGCDTQTAVDSVLRTDFSDVSSDVPTVVSIYVTVTPSASPVAKSTPESSTQTSSSDAAVTTGPTTTPIPAPAPKTNIGPIIGGAVGGGLVLIGLIGAAIFFLCVKKRKNDNAPVQPMSQPPQGPPPGAHQAQAYQPPFDQGAAMSPPMSPYTPASPYSPPPGYAQPVFYGQEKSPAVNVNHAPAQPEVYSHVAPADGHELPAQEITANRRIELA